jgi:hypothetical protein
MSVSDMNLGPHLADASAWHITRNSAITIIGVTGDGLETRAWSVWCFAAHTLP